MDRTAAAGLALLAAAGFATSAVLQQRAAQEVSTSSALRPRLLLELARRPLWLVSIGCMVLAYVAQAVALFYADVSFVEPLIAMELVFALPFAVSTQHRRPQLREWLGAFAVVAGVGAFLAVGDPHGGNPDPSPVVWIFTAVAVGGLVAVLVSAATGPLARLRAPLLAACAGTCFATLALITKSVAYLFNLHGIGMLAYWQPYAVVAVGLVGFVFSQSAYQAGPLESSLPVIDTVEPIFAVLLGILAFGERVALDAGSLAGEALGGALAA